MIYTRVSLNRNGGRSVEDQELECRAECARRGWEVRAVYCDNGISASRYGRSRPQWEQCKASLRADDVLVLWESSRAQRDMAEFVTLRDVCAEMGVLLSYSGRVLDLSKGDDRFTGGLDALLAERESEVFRERVLRGKRAGVAAGRPAGRIPWGYRSAGAGVWEPDPGEAWKVQEAVARILRGESYKSVWTWLQTQEGYRPGTLTVMSRSLLKPSLAGHRVHRGKVVGKGNWEPLIGEDQHRQLVARHGRMKEAYKFTHNPGPTPKHLLSGIATCGKCEDPLTWRKNRHGTPIYACTQGHVTRLAATVDELVENELFAVLEGVDPKQFEGDDSPEIWDRIDELEAKRAEWQALAEGEEITPQSFAKFEQGIDKQIAALEAQLAPPDYVVQDLAGLRGNWGDTPMVEKRRIVRAFFTITVNPSTQGHRVGGGLISVVPIEK